ncbi:MAG: Ig-like domain-containing protein [Lachnospiraceae bacterium]|nr:Ig-like domain-containing protein [Lachnospiraceae bacterium]
MNAIWIKKIKRVLIILLILLTVSTVVDTVPVIRAEAATVKARSIRLNYSAYALKKGKTVTLKASVSPANTTQKTIVWTTNNKSIATVNSKGVVKGIKNGVACIVATVKGTTIRAICRVSVGTPVTKISLNKSSVTVNVGSTFMIKPTVSPQTATDKSVAYTTSDPGIASVDSKGKITGKKAGTAVITVKAKDGSGKKAAVKVTVKNIEVTSVKVMSGRTLLSVGDTTKAAAKLLPSNATIKTVKWTSSAPGVASVDAKGVIRARSAGVAVISATAHNRKKSSCRIIVRPVDKAELLPLTGRYLNEDGEFRDFMNITLIKDGSEQKVLLTGIPVEFTCWDSVRFDTRYPGIIYKVFAEDSQYFLAIEAGNTRLALYPLVYEMDAYFCFIKDIKDGDNYIVDISAGYYREENGRIGYILEVSGENESMATDIEPLFYRDDVTGFHYEPVKNSAMGIGRLTVYWKSQAPVYWVRYKQQFRELKLKGISSDDSVFTDPQCEQKGNDNWYGPVWIVRGTKAALEGTEQLTFDAGEENYEIIPAEDGLFWNYIVRVTYKGETQILYLKYTEDTSLGE